MQHFPFGYWKSPIDEAWYSRSGGRLNQVQFGPNGSILITEAKETRSLFHIDPVTGKRRLNGTFPVGGTVAYGGGDFDASENLIAFCSPGKGLCLRGYDKAPPRLLVETAHSVSSPKISPDERFIVFIESDGVNDWLTLASTRDGTASKLVQGADFYVQPSWSPDGKRIAWTEWDHPHMAWAGSRVMIGAFDPDSGKIGEIRKVAGGTDFPADQPDFSPDGKFLSYIVSNGEWQDIVVLDLISNERRIVVKGDRAEFSQAAFVMGIRTTAWFGDGRRILFRRQYGVRAALEIVSVPDGTIEKVPIPARYSGFDHVAVDPLGGAIAAKAVSPYEPPQVIRYDNGVTSVVHRLEYDELSEDWISEARELSWEASDGSAVHGVYYAPKNPDFGWNEKPPAFVMVHGGPTAIKDIRFSLERSYFTSRGYGWLDVNYRGSTGYGRAYLNALNGFWGWHDVEDVISGANCIGKFGLADRDRLLVIGGSAGGYTVLNALSQFPDSFKAGASLFGVTNLYSLSLDTHKIELHYNDSLVGTLPKDDVKYRDWSPCFHAGRIKSPLAVFQGEADPVVPLNQAQELVAKLSGPKVVRFYPGEGHGFRRPETNLDYIRTLTSFVRDYL